MAMTSIQKKEKGLTVKEAADVLRYHPMTLYRYGREGKIHVQHFGRNVRIFPSENAELWEQRSALLACEGQSS